MMDGYGLTSRHGCPPRAPNKQVAACSGSFLPKPAQRTQGIKPAPLSRRHTYQARPCSIYAFEFYRGLGARRRGLTCTHGYPQRAPHKQLSPRMVPTFQDRGHAQQELARPPIARPYYQARPWRNYTFDFFTAGHPPGEGRSNAHTGARRARRTDKWRP